MRPKPVSSQVPKQRFPTQVLPNVSAATRVAERRPTPRAAPLPPARGARRRAQPCGRRDRRSGPRACAEHPRRLTRQQGAAGPGGRPTPAALAAQQRQGAAAPGDTEERRRRQTGYADGRSKPQDRVTSISATLLATETPRDLTERAEQRRARRVPDAALRMQQSDGSSPGTAGCTAHGSCRQLRY